MVVCLLVNLHHTDRGQLIWSAALASNAGPLFSASTLLCKDPSGIITPWSATLAESPALPSRSRTGCASGTAADPRTSPLSRIAELFNVNHFVVSQARPYIAPFLQTGSDALARAAPGRSRSRLPTPGHAGGGGVGALLRVLALELRHRLRQLDTLGLVHHGVRRLLLDDAAPVASLTLVPELGARDFVTLLARPTRRSVDAWILRGERSVWPAVAALKVRCALEVELDTAYQLVRRRKPLDVALVVEGAPGVGETRGESRGTQAQAQAQQARKRARTSSLGHAGVVSR